MQFKYLPFAVIALFVISSCKKNTNPELSPPPTKTSVTAVYVTGNVTAANLNSVATVWKNGVATALADSSVNSYATGIAVIDTDVYISGTVNNTATVWKNGVATSLPGGNEGNGIAVSGKDVYVVGTGNPDTQYAAFWKNGQPVTVTNNTQYAYATGIAVAGSDVYIAGNNFVGGFILDTYWKNGTATTLLSNSPDTSPQYYSGNVAIGVSGNNVYVTGNVENAAGDQVIATYLKNGVPVTLEADQTRSSEVNSINVIGNDVYATGYYDYFAMYWKNGTAHKITNGIDQYTATGITTNGSDIYIAGYSGYSTTNAVYWKNGNVVPLSKRFSVATGIAVVKH